MVWVATTAAAPSRDEVPEEHVLEPEVAPDASMVLVASGGVSLGAYQAGFLHMALRVQQQRDPDRRLVLAAGTSAGSANALITALNSCRDPVVSPQEDLGWKLWTPLGLDDLFRPEEVTPLSMFSRSALKSALEMIWEAWREGLPESCDVVLAFAVTRLDAHAVEIRPDFAVPRQEEKIRLRIRGRGYGVPPRLTNYVDPRFHLAQLVLNLKMDDHRVESARHNFDQLADVIFASTGFPVAFEPQEIAYCLLQPVEDDAFVDPDAPYCPTPTHRALFVDGGVFDNYPLRLAERVVVEGLRSDSRGRSHWRDLTRFESKVDRPPIPSVFYAYVDPFNPNYPTEDAITETATRSPSLIGMLSALGGNFVAAARSKELYGAVEDDPDLASRMFVSATYHPTASEPLGAFMGFMEGSFRRFDYYLGMYDALSLLRSGMVPGDALPRDLRAEDVPAGYRPLACLVGVVEDGREGLLGACQDVSRSFRILLQVSVDELHERCRAVPNLRLDRPHPRCTAASRGGARPRVPGVAALDDATVARHARESAFDHRMRLLEAYRFAFEDLGLEAHEAKHARLYIKRRLVKMVDALADAQPAPGEKALIKSGVRALTDSIAYDPAKLIGWALLGTHIEGGVSVLPWDGWPSWFRWAASIQYKGWTSVVSDEPAHFIGALTAGPEFELQFLSSTLFSPYLGLRGGGQLSTLDGMGGSRCSAVDALGDGRNCSQALIQTYLAATAVRWFRLQVLLEVYPSPPVLLVPDLESLQLIEERRYIGFQFALGFQFQ